MNKTVLFGKRYGFLGGICIYIYAYCFHSSTFIPGNQLWKIQVYIYIHTDVYSIDIYHLYIYIYIYIFTYNGNISGYNGTYHNMVYPLVIHQIVVDQCVQIGKSSNELRIVHNYVKVRWYWLTFLSVWGYMDKPTKTQFWFRFIQPTWSNLGVDCSLEQCFQRMHYWMPVVQGGAPHRNRTVGKHNTSQRIAFIVCI